MQFSPKTRFEPTEIAPETFLIHDHHGEGQAPCRWRSTRWSSAAAEPVVVDTGLAENREQFLADVFCLVEPETSAGSSSATTMSTTRATSTR